MRGFTTFSLLVLMLCSLGACELENKKCLERCRVDLTTAEASCEAQIDPPACKEKAREAEAACKKTCAQ